MSERRGYRGYMGARMAMGRSVPQSVQQLAMREHCRRRGVPYLLAATEYCMPGSTMVLDGVLGELDRIAGIVMYSVFLFPRRREKRLAMYETLLARGGVLHTAAEGIVIESAEGARKVEDLWLVVDVLEEQDPGALEALGAWDEPDARDARDQLPRRVSETEPS